MKSPDAYNEIAARNVDRLSALSDGIFAFAMTLLVLDVHVPDVASIHNQGELVRALGALGPQLGVCLLTFMTLGIFWVGQQTMLNKVDHSDRNLTWIHLGFLALVVAMPFSTAVLTRFIEYPTAVFEYWLNILLLGSALLTASYYSLRAGLLDEHGVAAWPLVLRRVGVSQAMYAFALLFVFVNTRLAVALIFLFQLNFVLAPRWTGWLSRV